MAATAVTHLFFEAKPRTTGKVGAGGVASTEATTIPHTFSGLTEGNAYIVTANRVDSTGTTKNPVSSTETFIGVVSSANFINCTRAVEGVAQAWAADTVLEILATATGWNKLIEGIEVNHAQTGHLKSGAQIDDTTADHQYVLGVSELEADRTVTLPLLTGNDEFVFKAHTQTLENKTLTSPTVTSPTITGTALVSADGLNVNSIYRQAIMNGDFQVAQRATTFVAGANNDDVYTLDRWNLISDGNDVFDVSQEATEVPDGAAYSIKLDVETAKRGGIVQFLENKNAKKFKGKSVSVSFSVKSANIAALRCAVLSWAGTADTLTSDVVGTWADTPTWATNWTAENTPADLTVTSDWTTVKVENIAIDSATVNNLALVIWTPNEETIGDIVYITNVQMNEGAVALPFQPKSFEEELRACQRFCYGITTTVANELIGYGFAILTTACRVCLIYPVNMRITPTLTATASDWQLGDGVGASIDCSTIGLTAKTGFIRAEIEIAVASGLTQFRTYALFGDGTIGRIIILSSEL